MAKKLTFNKKSSKEGERKEEKQKNKFPSISRFIPEKPKENYLFLAGFIFIIICSLVVGFDLYQNFMLQKRLIGETAELQRKIVFWENETKEHPDFRDAYFNLALINYQLRNFESSKLNLEKALNIDPNFKKGRKFQEILSEIF